MLRFSVDEVIGIVENSKTEVTKSPPMNSSSIIFILILFIILILAIYLYKKFFKKT